jgi:hypothetical protein
MLKRTRFAVRVQAVAGSPVTRTVVGCVLGCAWVALRAARSGASRSGQEVRFAAAEAA